MHHLQSTRDHKWWYHKKSLHWVDRREIHASSHPTQTFTITENTRTKQKYACTLDFQSSMFYVPGPFSILTCHFQPLYHFHHTHHDVSPPQVSYQVQLPCSVAETCKPYQKIHQVKLLRTFESHSIRRTPLAKCETSKKPRWSPNFLLRWH